MSSIQNRIFKNRILNEQIAGFSQTEPTPTLVGGTPERRPRSEPTRPPGPTMQTGTLYQDSWPSFPRWDMAPKWVAEFDAYLDAGGAWQKEVPMPWPPYAINSYGEVVTYTEDEIYTFIQALEDLND